MRALEIVLRWRHVPIDMPPPPRVDKQASIITLRCHGEDRESCRWDFLISCPLIGTL